MPLSPRQLISTKEAIFFRTAIAPILISAKVLPRHSLPGNPSRRHIFVFTGSFSNTSNRSSGAAGSVDNSLSEPLATRLTHYQRTANLTSGEAD
jgi:hypothetical protein